MNQIAGYPRWNTQLSDEYSDDTILWRYFSIEKFLKLFSQGGLYFRKISKFEDPHEGIPIGEHFIESMNQFKKYNQECLVDKIENEIIELRDQVYVNCWNQKKDESYLLWKAYSNLETGILIKSTYRQIKEYFELYIDDAPLYFGKVNYGTTLYKKSDWSIPFSKMSIFSEESEFRIIYKPKDFTYDGIIINGNLIKLIDEVHLAPQMSRELENILRKEIVNNGINDMKIVRSSIYLNYQ